MKIKSNITISRIQGGREDFKPIRIVLADDESGISFFEGRMSLADFASCLTGLSGVEIDGEVRSLEDVGKTKIIEQRIVEAPKGIPYGKESEWLAANYKEEGWKVNSYLGSRESKFSEEGKDYYKFTVFKFVPVEEIPV